MKVMVFLFLLVSSSTFAQDLINCRLIKDAQIVQEVESFDITGIETKEPEASIDGGLFNYQVSETEVSMSFSNECDNMYEITFQTSDLKLAVKNQISALAGKAKISFMGFHEDGEDFEAEGDLHCQVR